MHDETGILKETWCHVGSRDHSNSTVSKLNLLWYMYIFDDTLFFNCIVCPWYILSHASLDQGK
jgi:hypothetical protein